LKLLLVLLMLGYEKATVHASQAALQHVPSGDVVECTL
jgi:hypothetical protein